ncbi:cation diffusion facilitator family transporter [Alteromonas facilis]|uniref:cation diffusion facilitator family transporter n=1 Tax=Alteromonas facilis TaxID=2048004 RepID=UPI000C282A32|nr:cation diffusion facilitator family transporter [Alteromonas facilis]
MQVKHVLIIEGSINLLIMALKLVVGLMTHSTAILADAFHSLTDVGNNIVAWFAQQQSEQPADKSHPYGHQKFVPLAIFFLATLLSVVAVEIVITAVERFGEPVNNSSTGLVILIGALVANILLTTWEHHWAKRLNSDLLHADASHTLSDVLSSITIIAGWQLAAMGWYWLDTLFAICMAVIILFLAYRLFKKSIPILVDGTHIDHNLVRKTIGDLEGVKEIRKVRTRFDGQQHIGDITVATPSSLSLTQTHELADQIEAVLAKEFGITDAVVHIEPKENKN